MKKIKLYTNIEKTRDQDNPHEEVEQRLTITANGHVTFNSSVYDNGSYRKGRKEEIDIPEETVKEIFDHIEAFFAYQPHYNILPGYGMWELSLINERNRNKQFFGATSGVYGDLTSFIARRVPIDHLLLFL